jgi:cobalamin biosynthesis protein CobT
MGNFGRGQVQLYENTLEKVARIFAEQYGIKVIFKHDLCMTDGKTIYLPVIPEGASEEFLEACHGYVDHEVSHCLHSDFEVVKEASKVGKKHRLLTNAFEDPRVDNEMIKLWRGSKINLENCREWSLKQLAEHWDELSEFGKFVLACTLVPFLEDHWFIEEKIKQDKELMETLDKVKDILDKAPEAESTQGCFGLAKEVMEKLAEEDEEDTEFQNQQEKDSEQKQQGKEEAFSEVTEKQLEKDSELLSKGKQIQNKAKEEQSRQVKRKAGEDNYLIFSTENDEIEFITDGDKVGCKQFLDESRQITNSLGRKFRLNLVSETKSRWDPGKRRGKLNHRQAYKVPYGTSKNVFKTKVIRPGFDTVASMLIDHSNSMNSSPINLAAKTAMVFGENLATLNIPFEILGYSTGYYNEGDEIKANASEEERQLYTRWGKLWLGVYKKFEESWGTTRHRCYHMSRHGKYNTYDGESVRIAAQRLLRRPEKRRILFVICDGYPCPNCQEHSGTHIAYLKSVAKEVEKVIELFAIGIGYHDVGSYYKNSVGISDIGDLPNVMLTELDRLLRRGQNAYARG